MRYFDSYAMRRLMHPDSSGGAGGTAPGTGQGDGAAQGDPGTQTKPPSFDDLLNGDGMQSEFDRRVTKALETAKVKWETEAKNRETEAARMAKLSAEERAKAEAEKKAAELTEREAQISRREMQSTAQEELSKRGLPMSLAKLLPYDSAEACNAGIDALEKEFRAAVQAGVEERLKGKGEPKAGGGAPDAIAGIFGNVKPAQ